MTGAGSRDRELLAAAADSHRVWFARLARAAGGRTERFGDIELVITGAGGAAIPFPSSPAGIDDAVRRIRRLGLRDVGCWSLAADAELGTSLVARGFGWGWQPHWMALDLRTVRGEAATHQAVRGEPATQQVVRAEPPYAEELPYTGTGDWPPDTLHLGVRAGGLTVGHVVVSPWQGVAGIYCMGVAPRYRRRGIGRALTIAAAQLAAEQGCRWAVLNATPEGERVYRGVGFRSLGWGQTWWYSRHAAPTPRQVALAEAIGGGALTALVELDPVSEELRAPLPGGTGLLQLAMLTDQLESAGWLLDRDPALAQGRFEPFGATLLHIAVESDRSEFARLALAHGADPQARDRTWNATAREWAEHFDNQRLAELLADAGR